MKAIREALSLRVVVALLGLGLLAAGLAMAFGVPAALIVVGAVLFGYVVWPQPGPRPEGDG